MAASVLIIDADEAFALDVADALRVQGVDASTTGDGKLGLDLARINLPSAIVLCVELPRMSGYSVCAKLKKDGALKSVPVIITSSEATPETFEQHKKLKSRAEEYMKKPVPVATVVEAIRGYIAPPVDMSTALLDDDADVALLDDLPIEDPVVIDADFGGDLGAFQPDVAVVDDVPAETAVIDSEVDFEDAFRALSEPAGTAVVDDVDDDEALTNIAPMVSDPPEPVTADHQVVELVEQVEGSEPIGLDEPVEHAEPVQIDQAIDPAEAMDAAEPIQLADPIEFVAPPPLPPSDEPTSADGPDLSLIAAAAEEAEGLRVEIEALRAQLESAEDGRVQAERARDLAMASAKAAVESATSRPSITPGSHLSSRDALELKKQRNALERELIGFKEQLAAKERQGLQFHEREAELEAKIVELEDALQVSTDTSAGLETQLHGERAKLAESERQVADLDGRLNEATSQIAELEQSLASLVDEAKARASDIVGLHGRISEHESAFAEAQARIGQLMQEGQQRSELLATTEQSLAEATARGDALQAALTAKHDEAERLAQSLTDLDSQHRALSEAHDALGASFADTTLRLEEAAARMDEDSAVRSKALKAMEIAMALLSEDEFEQMLEDEPVASDPSEDLVLDDVGN